MSIDSLARGPGPTLEPIPHLSQPGPLTNQFANQYPPQYLTQYPIQVPNQVPNQVPVPQTSAADFSQSAKPLTRITDHTYFNDRPPLDWVNDVIAAASRSYSSQSNYSEGSRR
jgi:hypothetical protein